MAVPRSFMRCLAKCPVIVAGRIFSSHLRESQNCDHAGRK
ncbi:hypothetical protein EIO_2634 [Ketogulonicigenium vulgare Y25]|uniref:Uncharacterized protein n=1 Tax=Ketogulonicigenium vulgare (strain WSH-001) TaxID=759362 RepID=F9Y5Q4_KETVW|nr:hypothetical protein EIO_2634 [Ketogulonicigenium vulgare Y25]AEM41979.1 hypothetical protein KVU_2140 [Ketogulonicigenium vulgare WSH-001]ALJ82076.1 hypothetical protein KVH_13435 [Ketogulonicigenium vulgare]ANW35212.1 hypothetical protein KvSKV_13345 [Ketogulonicigenium vulgare]AOZ55744.1 hypothetical protein KVC_2742 [Ketogulonicigenium vulgare]